MTLTNSYLLHEVFVKIFDFLGLPELRREYVFVSVSYSATAMCIEAPLIQLTVVSYSSSMILINIDVDKPDSISIISDSTENRLCLHIISTTESTLTIVTS